MGCKTNDESRTRILLGKDYEKLQPKTVAIIGVGGTGCTVALLLARSGVGKLILYDGDVVEECNLERQILFDKKDVGKLKVNAAKEKLAEFCGITACKEFVNEATKIPKVDLVIDCTDTMESRYVINDYCKRKKIPWIHTAAIGYLGTVFLIMPRKPDIRSLYPDNYGEKCSFAGVLNATVTLVGSIAASAAIDYLAKGRIEKKMLRIDMQERNITKIRVKKRRKCRCNQFF